MWLLLSASHGLVYPCFQHPLRAGLIFPCMLMLAGPLWSGQGAVKAPPQGKLWDSLCCIPLQAA